jgi:hypothetical protein
MEIKNIILFIPAILIFSCGTFKDISQKKTRGNYTFKVDYKETPETNKLIKISGVIYELYNSEPSEAVFVKNLINDRNGTYTDSLGRFELYLNCNQIQLSFDSPSHYELVTDTIQLKFGTSVKFEVLLDSYRVH